MASVLDREPIDKGLLTFLQTVTNRPGDLLRAPDDARLPYFILYPIDGGGFDGSMMFPAENAELVYQVTSVGGTASQVQQMGDRIWRAILERDAAGKFKNVIAIAGIDITDRRPYGGRGSLDRQSGAAAQEHVVVSLPQQFLICASA